MTLLNMLIRFIQNNDELRSFKTSSLNADVMQTMRDCVVYCTELNVADIDKNKNLEIESVIDFLHDELNTGHWSEVPLVTRQYFTIASFVKCLIILKNAQNISGALLRTCLKSVDTGLLMGAPLDENYDLLTNSAKFLTGEIHKISKENAESKNNENMLSIKRNIYDDHEIEFAKLNGREVDSKTNPSLEHFNKATFLPQIPVKLKGCMEHWAAMKKWLDLDYLLKVAGERTVPIEIGSHYLDENWSQKLMTLKEFILKHYLSESADTGYLAQHNLFEQIPELKEDIHIPDYCSLSLDYENATDPDINAWFGPEGTISPLHYDPKNNILAQVYGAKQILLFSPKDTPYLYPHEGGMLSNSAQVNPLKPDLEKYPNFSKATMFKCLLEPGDMLFIPVKWWHHVTALEKSFSVSFWWQ